MAELCALAAAGRGDLLAEVAGVLEKFSGRRETFRLDARTFVSSPSEDERVYEVTSPTCARRKVLSWEACHAAPRTRAAPAAGD